MRKKKMSSANSTSEKTIISELMLLKLATRVFNRASYSFGSMMRVMVLWILEKKEESTVPISRTYRMLWLVFRNR